MRVHHPLAVIGLSAGLFAAGLGTYHGFPAGVLAHPAASSHATLAHGATSTLAARGAAGNQQAATQDAETAGDSGTADVQQGDSGTADVQQGDQTAPDNPGATTETDPSGGVDGDTLQVQE